MDRVTEHVCWVDDSVCTSCNYSPWSNNALDACIAAIQAMQTIEDESGYPYIDLTVPDIVARIDALRATDG
jgi:hypothetical protein